VLSHLVDKSLVAVRQDGQTRYRLLETIRHYAHEKLRQEGEIEAIQRQHASFFLDFAKMAEPKMKSAERGVWLDRLECEYDNLRAVLGWSRESGEAEMALELAGALSWFWHFRGSLGEAREWLEAALTLSESQAEAGYPQARAYALYWAGSLARDQGDYVVARSRLEESVAIFRRLGPLGKPGLADALTGLGVVTGIQGDYTAGRSLQEEGLAIYREVGGRWGLAFALHVLAMAASSFEGNEAIARSRLEESLALWREVGDKWGLAMVLFGLGLLAFRRGEYAAVRPHFEESLAFLREVGDKRFLGRALAGLGAMLQLQGDDERAAAVLAESLALNRELGDQYGIAVGLAGLAQVATVQGQPERAARLFGMTEALGYGTTAPVVGVNRLLYERAVATARAGLSEEAFAAAWAQGRAMTLEEAIADAFSLAAKQ
jgi:tetratricopeptide (TPR) repeat protein